MASRSLGTLTLDVIAQVGGFVAGMDKAERSSSKWRKQVAKDMKSVGTAIAAGVSAAAAALTALTVSTVENANEISRFAAVANTSTTQFQKLAAGAKTVGVENDQLADILKDVNDKVGDFLLNGGGELQDFFKTIAPKVGVTAEQFRNLSGPDALQLFASSLQKAGLSQAEMTQQMESLANDATLLIPLLRDNGKAFDVLGSAAESAGAIMDEKTIKASQDLAAAGWLVNQSFTGVKNQITTGLMPSLVDYAGILADMGQDTGLVSELTTALDAVLKGAAKTGLVVAYSFELLWKAISGVSDIITTAFDGVDPSHPIDAFKKIQENAAKSSAAVAADLDGLDKKYTALGDRVDSAGSSGKTTGRVKEVADAWEQLNQQAGKGTFKAATADAQAAAKAAQDAQKKLQGQFSSTEKDLERQIALIQTEAGKRKEATELAQLQFDLESGSLKGLSAQQQERLKGLATELDRLKDLRRANEDNAKAAAYGSQLDGENDTAKAGFGISLAGAGMGDKERARLQEVLQIRQDFNDKYADLVKQRNSGDISQELFDTETDKLKSALDDRYDAQLDYYNKVDEAQSNWLDGATSAWENYRDAAMDYQQQASDFVSGTLDDLTSSTGDAFAAIIEGQESAGDAVKDIASSMASSIIAALAKMAAQWLIYQGVQLLVGKTTQSSAALEMVANAQATSFQAQLGAYAATAAIPFVGPELAPAAAFAAAAATAPMVAGVASAALSGMAHDGIDSVPETGTWLLQKGERVTTAGTSAKLDRTLDQVQANSTGGGGGRNVTFNAPVTVQAQPGMSDNDARAQGKTISEAIKQQMGQFLDREMAQGGRLWRR